MSGLLLHPVLPFVVAAALAPIAGRWGRRVLSLLAPAAGLALLALLPSGATLGARVAGLELVLLRLDGLSLPFAAAFLLYALIAAIYAWTDTDAGPKVAALGLAGAGTGVVLAGDLLTLFFFWEWLSVTSLFLVWFGHTRAAWAAGFRYLIFHLAGAVALLTGVLLLDAEGIRTFDALPHGPAAWLVLAGFLVNAAVPPLHAWLSDAYPRASVYGTVFLAAFTTKAAVYALARGFPGTELLVWAGAIMALFGVVYAVLENDIRRLLAYHVISQVGYMVAGVGLGTELSLNGAAAHAFAHVFYKGLLLMAAGAVIVATARGKLTELGQLAGPLRWTLVLMMIGAFSISGAPLLSGFVSKSMVVSAAAAEHRGAIELMLLVASMGTFLHTGLKLPWFTFFGADQGARVVRPVPASMYVAMILAALVCVALGVAPGATLYPMLPFAAEYHPYTGHHVLESLQLLLGTALGFWILRVKLGGQPTVTIDIDRAYRQPLLWAVETAGAVLARTGRTTEELIARGIGGGWPALREALRVLEPRTLARQSMLVVLGLTVAAWLALLLRS